MDGLYFKDDMEPDDSIFEFKSAVEKLATQEGVSYIKIEFENKEDFYKAMKHLRNFNEESLKVTATSREDDKTLILQNDLDLDDRAAAKRMREDNTRKKKKDENAALALQ